MSLRQLSLAFVAVIATASFIVAAPGAEAKKVAINYVVTPVTFGPSTITAGSRTIGKSEAIFSKSESLSVSVTDPLHNISEKKPVSAKRGIGNYSVRTSASTIAGGYTVCLRSSSGRTACGTYRVTK